MLRRGAFTGRPSGRRRVPGRRPPFGGIPGPARSISRTSWGSSCGTRRAVPPSRGGAEDIRVEVSVDFLDMVRGGVREVRYRRPRTCAECGGTGRAGTPGMSRLLRPWSDGNGGTGEDKDPRRRAGRRDDSCPFQGGGAGVPGRELRPGRRAPDAVAPVLPQGGERHPAGRADPLFRGREGRQDPGPDRGRTGHGEVPAGSSSGRKLRLKGKGVPTPGTVERGDQFVILHVSVPKDPSEEFLKLVDRIAEHEDPELRGQWN